MLRFLDPETPFLENLYDGLILVLVPVLVAWSVWVLDLSRAVWEGKRPEQRLVRASRGSWLHRMGERWALLHRVD